MRWSFLSVVTQKETASDPPFQEPRLAVLPNFSRFRSLRSARPPRFTAKTIYRRDDALTIAGLKRFQPILESAKARDVNESDTVTIVTDLLQYVFGYDKYAEITSEHSIRGTFCDLAIKLDEELALLIEVKAIGLELKDAFVKQAVDYAANQGCDWVILTNGITWRAYRVTFGKPIEHDLVLEFNLLSLNHKDENHLELLWLLSKEGWLKAHLNDFHDQKKVLNRFTLAALMLSQPLLDTLRRELRRMAPGIKVDCEQISEIVRSEVIKRETLEGEKADLARKTVNRATNKAAKAAKKAASEPGEAAVEAIAETIIEQSSADALESTESG